MIKYILFGLSLFIPTQLQTEPIYSYKHRTHPVIATQGMVATQEAHATKVGLEILKQGGNAIDAAVAVGYALAVTLPRAGNLGGGGFMMIYSAKTKETVALDFREKAPLASTKDMFLNANGDVDKEKSRQSLWASGVPGTVYGLELARETYGTFPRHRLIKPAIKLASKGIPVSYDLAQSLAQAGPKLQRSAEAKSIFFKNDSPLKQGDTLIQKNLAQTLRQLSKKGKSAFYTGEIAQKLERFMKQNNGLITGEDLKAYRAVFRKPITGEYRGYTIQTMPPPSSGGIHLVQLLNTLSHTNLSQLGHNSADTIHLMSQAMKVAYADRSKYLGDTDFVQVPVQKLISKRYGAAIANSISLEKNSPSSAISPGQYMEPKEGNETTHFSVIDKDGNMVSCTYTLNFSYGNKIAVPGTGILLNNQMDDFSAKPGVPNGYGLIGGEQNAIQPEKRMLSSMTPTLVFKDGTPFMATGSPGGSRIITTVLQILLNVIDHNLTISEATLAPRIHHQWYPDEIRIEQGISPDTQTLLRKKGHEVVTKWAMGSTQSILFKNNTFYGASDPRKPGALTLGF